MNFKFIPLQKTHFPFLLEWLHAPHIKHWWEPDVIWTKELIQEKYEDYTQRYKWNQGLKKPLHAYVVSANNCPMGYIQFYNAYDFPREDHIALEGLPKSLSALDFFIGDEKYLGKGFASKILGQFLEEHIDLLYEACFVDPEVANIKAIRAYERVGFKKLKIIKEGRVTWMTRHRI